MGKEVLSSVWLVPTERDVLPVSKVIKDLSQRHNTMPFLPHITIYGEVLTDLEKVVDAAREAVRGIMPFSVEVDKLDYTTEWAKTLFAQIKPNQNLDTIHRRLKKRLVEYNDYVLNPHMSLVYKEEMTKEEKLLEIPSIKIPESFTLDRIAITVPLNPVAKWKDVARWQTPFVLRFNS